MCAYACMCMCTFVVIILLFYCQLYIIVLPLYGGVARVYGMCIVDLFISEGILLQ